MSTCGFVPNPELAAAVVAWVQALAENEEERTFLCFETGFDGRTAEAVREALDRAGERVPTLVSIDEPTVVAAVVRQLRKDKVRLLVTGPFVLPTARGQTQTSEQLLRAAPCQTFALLYGERVPPDIKRVLVVPTAQDHDRPALRLANRLRQHLGVHVTIGAVEEETGARAGRAGENYIRALLHDEALEEEDFETKVTADRLTDRGIKGLFEDHDLVLTGSDGVAQLKSMRQSLGDSTVAAIKRAPPLSAHALADWLPRINPADHADLRSALRLGSVWGPDFVGMLGLASAIASLGLLQNSPAVVIGSMLLAPLMTPMIGLGLAVAQGSVRLARQCGKSIVFGFLLTLMVSFLIGIITPSGATLSDEVLARGGPNVLDLLIAVFAAAAATFAMARPNISGAIAGVAIATALVPPVCSVGISLAQGYWLNAFGAATLFFTNLVAIIVVSNFTFSLLGISAAGADLQAARRAKMIRWGLVVLLLGLAGPLSTTLVSQLEEGKRVPLAYPVTQTVAQAVFERVGRDEDVEVIYIARPRLEDRVMIHLTSHRELPPSYASELRQIVRDAMKDPEHAVSVIAVQGLWSNDADL